MDKLKAYNWPGNVRELRNIVERSYYICEDNIITDKFLNDKLMKNDHHDCCINNEEPIVPLDVLEHKAIKKALIHCKGNIVQASELLGISRATIYRKINKYNINLNEILEKDQD